MKALFSLCLVFLLTCAALPSPPLHQCPAHTKRQLVRLKLSSLLLPRPNGEPPWATLFWKAEDHDVDGVLCLNQAYKLQGPQRVYDGQRLLYEGEYENGRLAATETFYTLELVGRCGEEAVSWLGYRASFKGQPCSP